MKAALLKPGLVFRNGKAVSVILSIDTYQELLEEFIRCGEPGLVEGRSEKTDTLPAVGRIFGEAELKNLGAPNE